MSGPTDPRVPVPPQPTPRRRVGAHGAAAAAVIVLACGAWLLVLESCAQTTANKPIQVDPQSQPDPDLTPKPSRHEHPAT